MTTDTFQRKLTAILSADVVGYSRLMGEDEEATVRTLNKYKDIISDLINRNNGRVIDSPGDNVLAEFVSIVDAVRCGVQIQEDLKANNEELPPERKMEFRIGINIGDVIQDGDRIYGDGVNVAARVESIADPGSICISGTAYDQVKKKLNYEYEDLGEYEVKNIDEPVSVYKVLMVSKSPDKVIEENKTSGRTSLIRNIAIILIVIIAGLFVWRFYPKQSEDQVPKTIAVLPFDDLSPEGDQEYFVLGLSEEILNTITKISDLQVTSKTSSFSFKNTDKTIQEIAEILEREYILEGSVRRAGNSLRITTQLIRAADDSHLWSETYDRELEDIFKIQEDIADSVADKLKLTLEAFQLSGGTENIQAYEHYLVAKGQMIDIFGKVQSNEDAYNKTILAQESLNEAVKLDSEFALAWAYKAIIHWYHIAFTRDYHFDEKEDPGLNAALKAIELEPNLAEAFYSLGVSWLVRGEFIEAENSYRKAMDLPNDPNCFPFGLRVHYLSVGHFKKANTIIEKNLQKDPLNETNYWFSMLASSLSGDFQVVKEKYERSKKIFGGQWFLGDASISINHLITKDFISEDDIVYSDPIFDSLKRYLYSPENGLTELRRIYESDGNLSPSDLINISIWAAYFDDPNFAMDAIEKGINANPSNLYSIWNVSFNEMQKLPRFKEFIREIGLVDYWKEYGWPDNNICRPVGDDNFECD